MKRAFLGLLVALAALLPPVANAQTLTVCDDLATNVYVPIYGYALDMGSEHTQFVYPARLLEEVDGANINSISFYVVSNSASLSGVPLTMKLAEVSDADTVYTNYAFKTPTTIEQVFSGTATIADGLLTVVFAEPYTYGGGNLLVDIETEECSYSTMSFNGTAVSYFPCYMEYYDEDEDDDLVVEYMKPHFLPKMQIAYGGEVSCPKPTVLTLSGVDAQGAELSWQPGSTESSWLIYVDGELTDYASEASYTFEGLSANMLYTVGVRAVCATDDTSSLNTTSFTTACGPMSSSVLPWTVDFDSVTLPVSNYRTMDLSCWVVLDKYISWGPAYPRIQVESGTNKALYFIKPTDGSEAHPIVALPQMEVAPGGLMMSFLARCGNNGIANDTSLVVGVLTDDTLASSFVPMDTMHFVAGPTNGWQYFEATFDTDLEGRLAFRYNGGQHLYIDSIVVNRRQLCDRPQSVSVLNVAQTMAEIEVGDPYALGHYGLRLTSGTHVVEAEISGSTSGVVSGLLPGRRYSIDAWAICADGMLTTAVQGTLRTLPDVWQELPYATTFDDEDDSLWAFYGTDGSAWTIGTAAADSGRSMYISNDGGQSYAYDHQPGAVSYAVRSLHVEPGHYKASFDWRCEGYTTASGYAYDYMRALLAPADSLFADGITSLPTHLDTTHVPEGWQSITTALNGSSSWQHAEGQFAVENEATYALVFLWRSSHNSAGGLPAAVDNVVVEQLSCPQVDSVSLDSVGQTWAAISWQSTGYEAEWVVSYADTMIVTDTTALTLQNLLPATAYAVSVRALCAEADTSDAHYLHVLTHQQPLTTLPYSTGFEDGDDCGWYFVNSHNGWVIDSAVAATGVRSLYISADSGATCNYDYSGYSSASYAFRTLTIAEAGEYKLSFDFRGVGELNSDFVRAWLAPQDFEFTAGLLPNGNGAWLGNQMWQSTPDGWFDLGGGKLNADTAWTHHEAVADVDTTGMFNIVFMWVNDNTGTHGTSENRAAAVDNVLLERSACPSVDSLRLESATTDALCLSWTARGSEQQWLVSYADTTLTVDSPEVCLTGLRHSTPYEVTVRPVCTGALGIEATITVRTACGVQSLPYVEDFEDMEPSEEAPCWTLTEPFVGGAGTNYPYVYQSTFSAYSGDRYLYGYLGNDGERSTIFATPAIEVGEGGLSVLLHGIFYKEGGDDDELQGLHLQAGVMADAGDSTTFVPTLDTMIASDDWAELQFAVGSSLIAGTQTHLAFRVQASGQGSAYFGVDSLLVVGTPADEPGSEPGDSTGIATAEAMQPVLSPNPATHRVLLSGISAGARISVADANGREVYAAQSAGSQHVIEVGSLPRGAYFVRVTDGNSAAVRKLIVR